MAISLDQFGKALVSSGLITGDDLKAVWSSLGAVERPKDGGAFAKVLVARNLLNDFQAKILVSGEKTPLVLGDYVVIAEIGAGGMGHVYKARHRRMDRIVALKVMSAAAMKEEAAVKRFQREVRAAAKLEHANIVTAYDSGDAAGVKYLVMQFVDGGDLSSLIKKQGSLPLETAVDYVLQAARGLAYAHGEGVVHRDIKPANLLLDKKGVVKILDMGLARIESSDDGLTGTEQVMGTVDYMSPEQASNTKKADARSDIYSLGCTLWYLLTGKRIYGGDTMISRLMAHRDGPLPSLVKTLDEAPWPLEQALHKMIAKKAEDRFQTMDAVIEALEPFGSGSSALSGQSGRGSSIGLGSSAKHDPELASFLKTMGPGAKAQATRLDASAAAAPVEATAQLSKPEAGTDPKSEVLPASPISRDGSRLAATPGMSTSQATRRTKPPAKLIAGGIGGMALASVLGIWLLTRSTSEPEAAAPGGAENLNTAAVTSDSEASGAFSFVPSGTSTPSLFDATSITPPTVAPFVSKPGDNALDVSAKLDAGNARVELPVEINVGRPFTLELTVLPRTPVDKADKASRPDVLLIRDGGGVGLSQTPNGWRFAVRLPGLKKIQQSTSTGQYELGRPVRLAAVSTGSALRVFGDGHLLKEFVATEPVTPVDKVVQIWLGGSNVESLNSPPFDGLIDEVRISQVARYDKDYVATELLEVDADTLALYHCDEGTGDVLHDASPHKRDGKIIGAKWLRADGRPNTLAPALTPPKKPTPREMAEWTISVGGTIVAGDAKGIGKIADLPPDLKLVTLMFNGVAGIDDSTLAQMAEWSMPDHLQLSNTSITDAGLSHLGKWPHLTQLHLSNTAITDSGLVHLTKLTRLRALRLSNTNITDTGLTHLESLRTLNDLSLNGAKVSASGVAKLQMALPNCLIEWDGATSTSLSPVPQPSASVPIPAAMAIATVAVALPTVTPSNPPPVVDAERAAAEWVIGKGGSVVLRMNGQTAKSSVSSTTELPLGAFQVARITLTPKSGYVTTDADLVRFRALPELQLLTVNWSQWTAAGMAELASSPKLDYLAIVGENKNAGTWEALVGLKNLDTLDLQGTRATADQIAALADLPNLTTLRIGYEAAPTTNASLTRIGELKNLKSLAIIKAQVGEVGTAAISQMVNLETLTLETPSVTDAHLEGLRPMKGLKTLRLQDTTTTDAGVAALQQALPNCKIERTAGK